MMTNQETNSRAGLGGRLIAILALALAIAALASVNSLKAEQSKNEALRTEVSQLADQLKSLTSQVDQLKSAEKP